MINSYFSLFVAIFFLTQCAPTDSDGTGDQNSELGESAGDFDNVQILKSELLPYGKNSDEPKTRVKTRFTVTEGTADFHYIVTLYNKQKEYSDTVYIFADKGDTLTAELIFMECVWDTVSPSTFEYKIIKNPQP